MLLYDELRLHGVSDSVQAVQTIVVRSAVPWMRHAVGQVSREELAGLKSEERRPWLMGKMSPFLNMNVGAVEVAAEQASFEVTHCHFPNLCTRVGVPELAPVFCAVDSHFLGMSSLRLNFIGPQRWLAVVKPVISTRKFRPKVNSPEDE